MGSSSVINDVVITQLRQINDERGSILHMLRSDASEFTKFGECYFSEILPGAVKAWKRHSAQTQNITVPVGRVRLVIYDDRSLSDSRGNFAVINLGRPDAYLRVQIPPGLWYGFQCLNQIPALLANCADMPHDPSESEVLPLDSDNIPYKWIQENEKS
jgi:dTDP-4-dehydrorhamnose 3,5-epimerase